MLESPADLQQRSRRWWAIQTPCGRIEYFSHQGETCGAVRRPLSWNLPAGELSPDR